MGYIIDHTGKKYGRLYVKGFAGNDKFGHSKWKCRCDCGAEVLVIGDNLKRGISNSCGCYVRDKNTTHNMTHHKLYSVWKAMVSRCHNKKDRFYHNYGKRGICVCREWRDSNALFFEWAMTHGYKEGLVIDRVDNDGPYAPWNCRFVTRKESSKNRRLLPSNNTSGYCGVHKFEEKYVAKVCSKHIGLFPTAVMAARARDQYVIQNNLGYPLNGV